MLACTCTRHHDEEICASCSYQCIDGKIICFPMPDLDTHEIIMGDGELTIRRKPQPSKK